MFKITILISFIKAILLKNVRFLLYFSTDNTGSMGGRAMYIQPSMLPIMYVSLFCHLVSPIRNFRSYPPKTHLYLAWMRLTALRFMLAVSKFVKDCMAWTLNKFINLMVPKYTVKRSECWTCFYNAFLIFGVRNGWYIVFVLNMNVVYKPA